MQNNRIYQSGDLIVDPLYNGIVSNEPVLEYFELLKSKFCYDETLQAGFDNNYCQLDQNVFYSIVGNYASFFCPMYATPKELRQYLLFSEIISEYTSRYVMKLLGNKKSLVDLLELRAHFVDGRIKMIYSPAKYNILVFRDFNEYFANEIYMEIEKCLGEMIDLIRNNRKERY